MFNLGPLALSIIHYLKERTVKLPVQRSKTKVPLQTPLSYFVYSFF